jgi:TolB-like protein/DNA-binding winged helix-turn-helix (wHTH) protein/Tfp pilus assembly protein PilF
MSDSNVLRDKVSFNNFTLDFERGALLGPEGETRLRPKSFEVLSYLVRNCGRLVSREELLEAIWGRAVVTEDSLTQCLVDIRRALGAEGRETIRTVPRRGYIFDPQGNPQASGAGATPAAGPRRAIIGPVLAVLVALLAGWWLLVHDRPAPELSPPRAASPAAEVPQSIAVLPFVDMSPEQDQEYFGDGISEEILNLLAQSPKLRVIARTSSFSLKGQPLDIPSIATRLGVAHVLEGSVRKAGNRVRVTAQLVDARHGVHLWSQSYDRELGDILAVQSEIAVSVATALRATLRLAAGERSGRLSQPAAYDHLLRGRHLFNRRAEGDVERARKHFEAALELDPNSAPAWASLAGAWLVLLGDGLATPDNAIAAGTAAADRALALDPNLPEAHLRALAFSRLSGDDEAAMQHARRAEALDPDNPLLLSLQAGQQLAQGRLDEAIRLVRRAIHSDPLVFTNRYNLVSLLLAARRLEEARSEFEAVSELARRRDVTLAVLESTLLILEGREAAALALLEAWSADEQAAAPLAVAHHTLGNDEAAEAILARLRAASSYEAAAGLAAAHALRGERDQAFAWLAESRRRLLGAGPGDAKRWRQLAYSAPFLHPLHDDPRWQDLLAVND